MKRVSTERSLLLRSLVFLGEMQLFGRPKWEYANYRIAATHAGRVVNIGLGSKRISHYSFPGLDNRTTRGHKTSFGQILKGGSYDTSSRKKLSRIPFVGVATPNHQHQEPIHRMIIMRLGVEQMPKVEHILVQAQLTHMKVEDQPRHMDQTTMYQQLRRKATPGGLHPQARTMINTLVRAMIHAEQLESLGTTMMDQKGITSVIDPTILKARMDKELTLSIPGVTLIRVPASPTLIPELVCRILIPGLASLSELCE
ncbi:MAG: hypothetical protein M1824_001574 [Vezdaea acicularis]|nr:MAG: hypothetical protein M1824_001574 [Vezdaea acicularis]